MDCWVDVSEYCENVCPIHVSLSTALTKCFGIDLNASMETMTKDFTPGQEKPNWPLTSYGPAKHQPVLISGFEESFEELRARAVTALKAGNIDEYVSHFLLSKFKSL